MEVSIIGEFGYDVAMLGLSLSFNSDIDRMGSVARKLYNKDGGHNKFLESMIVAIDITAPRYWWSQFDTYRIGVTKQSESTMHTLTKRELVESDFEGDIPDAVLDAVNWMIVNKDTIRAKSILPESFLQRRIVVTNYKTLRSIVSQRATHRLPEWVLFIRAIVNGVEHAEFFADLAERYSVVN